MTAESVTTSWLWLSSESGKPVFRCPFAEGVLNMCFLLSEVHVVTSEQPGKTGTCFERISAAYFSEGNSGPCFG